MFSRKHRVGWLCTYTPEEIILASDLYPVRIRGSGEDASSLSPKLPANMCPYVRGVLDVAGKNEYDDCAGVAVTASCDAMRRLADAWRRSFPDVPLHVIDFPRGTGQDALEYLKSQFELFRDWLEQVSGKRADEESLNTAIDRVNGKRELLLELSARRKLSPPGISGSTFFEAVMKAGALPYSELSSWYSALESESQRNGPRLLVTGSIIENPRIHHAVEEAGAVLVAEDTCTGLRWIEDPVEPGNDPLVSIARRYLGRPPCSRMSNIRGRIDYIMRLIREYRVDGVIYHCLKFCDLYQYDYPIIRKELETRGIPVLRIETDYREGDTGQLTTRIEAFLELLRTNGSRAER